MGGRVGLSVTGNRVGLSVAADARQSKKKPRQEGDEVSAGPSRARGRAWDPTHLLGWRNVPRAAPTAQPSAMRAAGAIPAEIFGANAERILTARTSFQRRGTAAHVREGLDIARQGAVSSTDIWKQPQRLRLSEVGRARKELGQRE